MKTKIIFSFIKKIAFSKLGRKLFFSFVDHYVDSSETKFDDNLRNLIYKLFDNDEDIRPEVAELTRQLVEKFKNKD